MEMETVYLQLNRYLIPATIILGTIGAVANQILFYFRKPLRTTSCALYFRALSGNDLIVLWFNMLSQWFETQFNISPMVQYGWYCKLYTYLNYTCYTLSPYFIVLACFDRLCTSSTNARLRKIATIRIATFLIPCMVILICIIYSFVLVWCELVPDPSYPYCAIINPIYSKFMAWSLLIFFCLIPPLLMIKFCIITFILLRQQRHRIMPVNQARLRHRDNQLLKMLFIYVTTNIVCIFPFTVTYFLQIYSSHNLSPLQDPLVELFVLLVNITYATSFYIYTLGTPFYRDELFSLLKSIWQWCHRNDNTIANRQPRRIGETSRT
jgi:hypothetical protein